jgi:hypothetical protein
MPLITSDQATEAALKQDGIIPDVLDSFQSNTLLMVSYGSNKEVALGNKLTVQGRPLYIVVLQLKGEKKMLHHDRTISLFPVENVLSLSSVGFPFPSFCQQRETIFHSAVLLFLPWTEQWRTDF